MDRYYDGSRHLLFLPLTSCHDNIFWFNSFFISPSSKLFLFQFHEYFCITFGSDLIDGITKLLRSSENLSLSKTRVIKIHT